MAATLEPLKQPVGIRADTISTSPTTLRIRQKCLRMSFGDFICIDKTDSSPRFTVDGKTLSLSQRRAIHDASGLPIFDMHRVSLGTTWYVNLPDQDTNPMVRLEPQYANGWKDWKATWKESLDVYVRNTAGLGSEEVLLSVRGQDIWKRNTHVYLGEQLVMDVKFVNLLSAYIPYLKDNEWDVRIAAGFDASVVSQKTRGIASRIFRADHK